MKFKKKWFLDILKKPKENMSQSRIPAVGKETNKQKGQIHSNFCNKINAKYKCWKAQNC